MDTFVDNVEDEAVDLRHKAFVALRKEVAAATKTGAKPAPAVAGVGLDDESGDPGFGRDTLRGDAPLPAPKLLPASKTWAAASAAASAACSAVASRARVSRCASPCASARCRCGDAGRREAASLVVAARLAARGEASTTPSTPTRQPSSVRGCKDV